MSLTVIATAIIILNSYHHQPAMSNVLYHECSKLFHPPNYMDQLPLLNLPYLSNLKMPEIPIKPTPVKPTKVISLVTKYLYKNPVCVKVSRSNKKTMCQIEDKHKNHHPNGDYIVTKEYFVKDNRNMKRINNNEEEETPELIGGLYYVQGSEEPRPFGKSPEKTPEFSPEEVQDMLIEDRLDQLETILPHYTRRRTYETSTITVTRVRSNNRATATLLVKNCVPQGYDLCPLATKIRRKSKVAEFSNSTQDRHYFG